MQKELLLMNPYFWFLFSFISDFFSAIFIYVTLGKKVNTIRAIAFGAITTSLTMFARLYCSLELIFLIGISTYILMTIFVLKLNILQSLLSVFLLLIALCPGEIFALFLTNLMGISNDKFNKVFSYYIFYSSISLSIFILIILIIYYSKIKINIIDDISRKRNISLIINGILTLFLIVPNILFFSTTQEKTPTYLLVFNIFAIVIFFGLSLYNTLQGAKLNSKSKELENQMLYNKTLTDLTNSLRGFRHDFSNTLSAINGYVSLNDLEGLRIYLSKLNSDYSSINSLCLANSTIINNPPIYGLIVTKYYYGETKGIRINLEISTDFLKPKINLYELCKIIGIFWDNAIEASEKSEKKVVNFKLRENEKSYLLDIENSFTGDINIQEIFKKDVSSKGVNWGLGLWEVKNITGKSKFITLKTSISNDMFIHQMVINKDK